MSYVRRMLSDYLTFSHYYINLQPEHNKEPVSLHMTSSDYILAVLSTILSVVLAAVFQLLF